MTNWRTVLNPLQRPHSLGQNTKITKSKCRKGDSVYFVQIGYSSRESEREVSSPPGEGPCPSCGRRLWCRLVLNMGAWECRRCMGAEAQHWKELLYVPENWKPLRAGAPNLTLLCPNCKRTVSTLLNQPPDGWRCAECHGDARALNAYQENQDEGLR